MSAKRWCTQENKIKIYRGDKMKERQEGKVELIRVMNDNLLGQAWSQAQKCDFTRSLSSEGLL